MHFLSAKKWLFRPLILLLAAAFVFLNQTDSVAQEEELSRPWRVVVFGDSLVTAYQLAPEDAFSVKLQKALEAKGYRVEVIDKGIAGDTTGDGRARLADILSSPADIVILELGANDMFQKVSPATVQINLEEIVKELVKAGRYVMLAGMKAPPAIPIEYRDPFERIYPMLANKYKLVYYPFFLEGVATVAKYNQPDGVHPNAEGVDVMVNNILPYVEKMLKNLGKKR